MARNVGDPTSVEQRSVDWIPHSERHGKVRDLGNVWFVGNVNLTAMATGVVALSIGANLIWTLIAIVLGSLFGTFFMAFHSAQGPQLGLPQLVQSRAQFGYIGAAITVWIFALINYWAYNTADAILSGGAINALIPSIPASIGFIIAAVVASVIAIYGYDQIHAVNKYLLWPSIVIMALLTVGVLTRGSFPAGAFDLGNFQLAPFMTVFVIIAGFQLGWAPYVSDYSRYLPGNIGVGPTFKWTYLPSALSGVWVFGMGAFASSPDGTLTPIAAFKAVGDSIFNGFGLIAVLILLFGLLAVMAINAYGGSLALISILDSFKPVKPTKTLRMTAVILMGVTVWATAAIVGEARFNTFYGNALVFLAYLFTPWTAINLIDYFFVRKGSYVIKEIFKKDGIYGSWGWRGNLAYLIGILVMIPFFVTAPYVGPIAQSLGSVDYSIFVGLPVSAIVYLLLAKGIDLKKEESMARAEGNLTTKH
ncbi:MAG: purine-cytosine permease family protein [Candidatus Nanopelagicales bacterium]